MARHFPRSPQTCEFCKHFYLHYVHGTEGRFTPTLFGHCTNPRIKIRRTWNTCPLWEPVSPLEAALEHLKTSKKGEKLVDNPLLS